MKIYRTSTYNNYKKKDVSNDVIVLNDEERDILARKLVHLVDKIQLDKTPLNFHDIEIITFLFTVLHFRHHPKAQMLDILSTQLVKIDKMLSKVYGLTFLDWVDFEYDGEITSKKDMFNHMQRKRDLEKLSKEKQEVLIAADNLKETLKKEVLGF